MENKKCMFSYTWGMDKEHKGIFIKLIDDIQEDDNGKKFQKTMALIQKDDGNLILTEPQNIKIIEEE